MMPLLTSFGFYRFTNRIFAKVVEDVLQVVMVDLSRRGNRWFGIEYASLCLFRPRDTLPLRPGGRLFRNTPPSTFWQQIFWIKGRQTGFPGACIQEASASMTVLVEIFQTQALPFFSKTGSVSGLCLQLEKEQWGSEHHLNFEIGCCLAKLHRLSEAERCLRKAAKLYEQDGREWCEIEVGRIRSLLTAIETGKTDELLDQWIEHSVTELGLRSLLVAQQLAPVIDPALRGCGRV
ncbi:tetratricopeptide repeat protein [Zoogloea sp.]|uniref:tetratricopeptide repeat protein n=1 Tax=Zoogloea sp. TaxID=49181 RepID=UPI0026126B97|nr:tetratricopeptide repeat protein [Zoogloea sp.]